MNHANSHWIVQGARPRAPDPTAPHPSKCEGSVVIARLTGFGDSIWAPFFREAVFFVGRADASVPPSQRNMSEIGLIGQERYPIASLSDPQKN